MSELNQAVHTIQFLAVDAVEKANSGHPGTPMALAGIGVELFTRYLRYVPEDPHWPNRDRFVLSCGHASMLLYSLLHMAGYDLPLSELESFRQWGSKTPGHPEVGHTAGVETTTGPLGQGVGNAVGMALAGKMMGARVNTEDDALVDYRVFALASDGDLMEGVASEAASIAGHLGLDNLVVVYDDNHITIDGTTAISFSEDVGKRFEAYGWYVQHVNGHDPDEVRSALDEAIAEAKRPSLIVARTHIAIGAPTKQDSPKAHGAPLGAEEIAGAKKAAGWPVEPPFRIPEGARVPFQQRVEEVRPEYEAWQQKVAALSGERKAHWKAHVERSVPANVLGELLASAPPKKDATRSLAGKVEQRLAALMPALVGGAADLAESTKTDIHDGGSVQRGEFGGRNLHFGIREHGMGAIMNGLALSGFFVPLGSTFLIFSDYMRPSIRLAALMEQQTVYVFTHDSVFLGEDGPTHQPVEQLTSLRLIPNLDVVRPADALECAAAWAHAATRRHGPTALVLSRQKLPELSRPAGFDPKTLLQGAYVLVDEKDPELVLIATGSEVGLAVEAQKVLAQRGKRARVVSAPCLEAFARLSAKEQEAVLGRGVRRVSIEAGRTPLWRSIVGLDGITIGIDRFGASAPYERIAEELGFTPEKVASTILERL
ncbi:MAG: transketolase [Myxococcales bacterium]|nr:transketolase [Myxococcales bacterium]MCB9581037.1 transketolase [Polyangiaceae bacterium]